MAKVLVADDSATVRHVLEKSLSESHEVITAENGRVALEQFKSQAPDLLLLDLEMPVIDGFEVCEAVKSETDVPVVILTSMDKNTDKKWALEQGADDYLTKPVDEAEINQKISGLTSTGKDS